MKKSLFALAMGTFILGMAEFVMEGILPHVANDLHVTIPQAGHAISVYAFGVCAGATLLVALHKVRPKKILLGLTTMIVTGALLSVTAHSYAWLLVARFISGLPHGAFFGTGTIVAVRLADDRHKATAVSMMCVGMPVANVIGVPLSTYLSSEFSWRLPFAVIMIVGVLGILAIWRWIPDLSVTSNAGFKGQFHFLKHGAPWLIIMATMLGNGGILAYYSYISPTLTQLGGLTPSLLPYLMAVAGIGMVMGNQISGRLSDHFTPGRITAWLQLLAAAGLLCIFFAGQFLWVNIAMMVLCCACLFGVGTPEQYLIIRHAKNGEMLGGCCIQIAFNFGNAVGAYLGGLPIDAGFGYNFPSLVGLPMVFAGFLFLVTFIRRYEPSK